MIAYDLSVARALDLLIVITVFAAIGIATTILRLESRKMRKIDLGLDDYFMLVALVRSIVDGTRAAGLVHRIQFFLFVSIGIQFS
jgi:hypothetical protein